MFIVYGQGTCLRQLRLLFKDRKTVVQLSGCCVQRKATLRAASVLEFDRVVESISSIHLRVEVPTPSDVPAEAFIPTVNSISTQAFEGEHNNTNLQKSQELRRRWRRKQRRVSSVLILGIESASLRQTGGVIAHQSASEIVNKAALRKRMVSIHHLHVWAQSVKTHKEIFAFSL